VRGIDTNEVEQQALSSHITHATGLDISSQMLEQYSTLLSSSHPSLHISTAIADFCSGETPSDTLASYAATSDIAGVALGFHHFDNPTLCISNLYTSLKPQGVLFIIDWLPKDVKPEDHIGHAHAHPSSSHPSSSATNQTETPDWQKMQKTIKTNGFTENDMREFFEGAGFTDFGFEVLEEAFVLEMNGKEVRKTGFIAKGRKG
jgi:ubiquinone/menaquinone biosynthesis C-methylase UbiE